MAILGVLLRTVRQMVLPFASRTLHRDNTFCGAKGDNRAFIDLPILTNLPLHWQDCGGKLA